MNSLIHPLDFILSHGCVICRRPAEIHHLRCDGSMGKKGERMIPLCPEHHRTGGRGVAYHAGRLSFERNFGSEEELWENFARVQKKEERDA